MTERETLVAQRRVRGRETRRMKLHLGACGVFAAFCSLFALGACSDDTTTTSGTTNTSSSSGTSGVTSSSSSSGDTSSSSSSGSSGQTSSSSSSSGGGPYTACSDCTNISTGAYAKECKAKWDACQADQACLDLFNCSFTTDMCEANASGGCCTLNCATKLATPQASKDLYLAVDKCIYCDTCTTICEFDAVSASGYCKSISGTTPCP
jgi:hypothetical protein